VDSGDVLMGIMWAGIGLVCAYFRAEYLLWRKASAADRELRSRNAELYKNRPPSSAQIGGPCGLLENRKKAAF
jgi:hypothetical protein